MEAVMLPVRKHKYCDVVSQNSLVEIYFYFCLRILRCRNKSQMYELFDGVLTYR